MKTFENYCVHKYYGHNTMSYVLTKIFCKGNEIDYLNLEI